MLGNEASGTGGSYWSKRSGKPFKNGHFHFQPRIKNGLGATRVSWRDQAFVSLRLIEFLSRVYSGGHFPKDVRYFWRWLKALFSPAGARANSLKSQNAKKKKTLLTMAAVKSSEKGCWAIERLALQWKRLMRNRNSRTAQMQIFSLFAMPL